MSDDLKHACHECGGNIAYPQHAFGAIVHCPHCGMQTTLGEKYASNVAIASALPQVPPVISPASMVGTVAPGDLGSRGQSIQSKVTGVTGARRLAPGTAVLLAGVLGLLVVISGVVAILGKDSKPSNTDTAPIPPTPAVTTPPPAAEPASTDSMPPPDLAKITKMRAEVDSLFELLQQIDEVESTQAELWNSSVVGRVGGRTQLLLIRDRIIPLVRETKNRVERFQPKDDMVRQAHGKMVEMMKHDLSSWVGIYNVAAAGQWRTASALFDRRELDRKVKRRQLDQALDGK